ncbi:MAG: Hpt domain-containing protein [Nitrospira sp.]|nr:Hpt domain-containing protein [Nitrospira sp.]MDH5252629.1 Hpt domain-containing protein [Nitrospira sp.]MDH5624924.1 Hpt domain-containing protein [Nitrospira sp.]
MEDAATFDLGETLALVDHDWETFQMMVELFTEQGPKDLAAIHASMAGGDAAALARAAHRMKGALLQFCAPAALAAARSLEEAGQTGMLQGATERCAVLETELRHLWAMLRRVIEQRGSV